MADKNEDKLKMTFMPSIVEHLGVKMYKEVPPVIAELIANSHDADATKVLVHLKDTDSKNKEIVVSDDGQGMSFSDINEKFLRIGRNRRAEESEKLSRRRKVIGKKGIGKLSFFGVADEIKVETIKAGKKNSFLMDLKKMLSDEDIKEYSPEILEKNIDCKTKSGTVITLRKIKRITDFNAEELADSIARFFIVDKEFKICIQRNNEEEILIKRGREYANLEIEFRWEIPKDLVFKNTYNRKSQVNGRLFTTKMPIRSDPKMRGVTLFSRSKLVSESEYFVDSISSHFFSYLTGWLEVDFVDEIPKEDVIGSNRQSLLWDHPEMVELKKYLQEMIREIEKEWRARREKVDWKKMGEDAEYDIEKWLKQVPKDRASLIKQVLRITAKDPTFPEEKQKKIVKKFQSLIPPYPRFHWQELHSELRNTVEDLYKDEHYYSAVLQGFNGYIRKIVDKFNGKVKKELQQKGDSDLLREVFCHKNPMLLIMPGFEDVVPLKTIKSIRKGYNSLARGMCQALRNPVAHETADILSSSGLYTKADCLDALGLLSYLYRKLEDAELAKP